MDYKDEDPKFWGQREKSDLANRVAVLHKDRRAAAKQSSSQIVHAARRAVADLFISGVGIEVGPGTRPFPIPAGAKCRYGDIRDDEGRKKSPGSTSGGAYIDAQTFGGIANDSVDFVISAHVIEHLQDPIGSIGNAIRVLNPGGVYVLAVSDMRFTFDKHRTPTPLTHLIADSKDGGKSTKVSAYIEHLRDVSGPVYGRKTPDHLLEKKARELAAVNHDIHFHAWTGDTFAEMLNYISGKGNLVVVGRTFAVNENIFVLRKTV